jgi:UDP-glucuronate 4-epimerase
MRVLLTGVAGFIGSHVAHRLLERGDAVVGLDNLNSYYDVALKEARLQRLQARTGFRFVRADVEDRGTVSALFAKETPERVIHLAAQAGVRYSLVNPHAYVDSNLVGFLNVLEGCRRENIEHLVYASSSSVYGGSMQFPFQEAHKVDHPVSLYAATKKANELMAHSYTHLFGVRTSGLRFFTVYGPWGRPDMALFMFTKAMLAGEPIDVFNNGAMTRDFTYVDDVVESVIRVLDRPPVSSDHEAAYRVLNVGNGRPTTLGAYIDALESALGISAVRRYLPMQAGDVPATFADTTELETLTGFRPGTSVEEGVARFVEWYRAYHRL